MKKSKTPKKTTKKSEDKIEFVLEGKVFLVETTNGKVTKTEIDGELVLKSAIAVLRQALP